MNSTRSVTAAQSGAFVEMFELSPTADGPLVGLRFAVKDLIDVAGTLTGCGNPTWHDTHPPAAVHAVCVEQLLAAGAHCAGKTVTDEMAFSLIGENHFYGTPLNPAALDRVPGGSSSGSASAVACGLVDFALGTDTGGSVRVPASNCGIWGLRPSHGFVSVAGVMPFAPTFDTVGILARSANVLRRSAEVLLAGEAKIGSERPTVHLLDDAFALVDPDVRQVLEPAIERLRALYGQRVQSISLAQIFGDGPGRRWEALLDTYCVLQWTEIRSSLGAWIAAERPQFGPATAASFKLVYDLERPRARAAIELREASYRALRQAIGPNDLLCLPTVPCSAPAKASNAQDRTSGYYRKALSLTSMAGIGRLPQVSLPLASTANSPVGLSLIGAHGQDLFLIGAAEAIGPAIGTSEN
ncbi:MAG TPA: amidase [Pirellulales bacterium]|jgi:amidase|nr:amidase [Pirellulales bacterium]